MIRGLAYILAVFVAGVFMYGSDVAALSLKIAPQKYEASLAEGETKKGFVDISNPQDVTIDLSLDVRAFRQISDDGSLEFFDSEQMTDGIKLDYDQITLGPREAMRVYFLLDGNKLPTGDVFAAIFASTEPDPGAGSQQSVSVGTLIIATNGTPSAHTADVSSIKASWLQLGDSLSATITLKNPQDEDAYTGFFPEVTIDAWPYGQTTARGPLLFAGRSRDIDYRQQGNYFGPILIRAGAGGAGKSMVIFAMTGYWVWLAPLLTMIIVVGLAYVARRRAVHRFSGFSKR